MMALQLITGSAVKKDALVHAHIDVAPPKLIKLKFDVLAKFICKVENRHQAYWSSKIIDYLDSKTMSDVTSFMLRRLTRKMEMHECCIYALNCKLKELEGESDTQNGR
jgi:hypothetical protein